MPELPEVNTYQNYFNAHALTRSITRVRVSDAAIIRNVSGRVFAQRLKGRTFESSYRRGKFLFGKLDNGHHVLLHFGMTGEFVAYDHPKEAPRHERFHFEFEDGSKLGFNCPRKFARILYLSDLEEYLTETGLGEDAMRISEADFLAIAKGKTCSIKGFLLNQKYLAGMGNLYADAVLYDTRVHPATRIHQLKPAQLKKIFKRMQAMLSEAVQRMPEYGGNPSPWYWDWRIEGNKPKAKFGLVKVITVAGRTTYYCEGWQQLPD